MRRLFICISVALFLASACYADVVIGDWEQSDDGWNLPPGSQYEPIIGVTLHDWSLHVTQSGYSQDLYVRLQDVGHVADFMANDTFKIDFTSRDGTSVGWNGISAISINAEGFGLHTFEPSPYSLWRFDYWEGSIGWTIPVELDYSEVFDTITNPPSYVEIIFALNSDGTHNDFYFDNARLTPEPMTIALLGLGGLMLRRRK